MKAITIRLSYSDIDHLFYVSVDDETLFSSRHKEEAQVVYSDRKGLNRLWMNWRTV